MVEVDRVAAALGLEEEFSAWLKGLAELPMATAAARLPGRGEAAELLDRLGCSAATIAEVVDTLPDREGDPERWWLLQRCFNRLVGAMGDVDADHFPWPQLPGAMGSAGRCFYFHLFLATMDQTQQWYARHQVPEEVFWATLSDLGRHEGIGRQITGETGIDEPWWMMLHLRGVIFEIGRLQYTPFWLGQGPESPEGWFDRPGPDDEEEGFRRGDAAVGVHIPAGSPLSPASCEESLRAAAQFFRLLFPAPNRRLAICSSWLLDDQLGDYLASDSNILGFQRLFHLRPGWTVADQSVLFFVFRTRNGALDGLPQETSLQRAVVSHLRSGWHFHWRTGWRPLESSQR